MNSKTDFKSMKVEAWPAVDRRLWIEARSEADDPDEDGGPASHWRPATVALVERGWGTFLDWSERTGRLIPDERPDERIARPVVRAFVTAYAEGHTGKTVVNAVRALIDFVRVTCPDTDLTHLDRVLRRWKRRAAPTKLPAERMRPASELLAIGAELIERGLATIGTKRVRGALAYRNGLIFLMELALPLRLSNVADLRIGETFRKEGNQWRAVQPGASMKNGLEHDGLYPAFLTPVIDHWVEVIRPLLRGEGKGVDEGIVVAGLRRRFSQVRRVRKGRHRDEQGYVGDPGVDARLPSNGGDAGRHLRSEACRRHHGRPSRPRLPELGCDLRPRRQLRSSAFLVEDPRSVARPGQGGMTWRRPKDTARPPPAPLPMMALGSLRR